METFNTFRFLFDLLYVVFMELLFQNLVGGIIIDAYSTLTTQDNERVEDKKGRCYICSAEKQNVLLYLFRSKNKGTYWKSTFSSITFGTIFTLFIASKTKTQLTIREFSILLMAK